MLDRIKKNSTIKATSVLSESKFYTDIDETSTEIPAINIALSGSINGGLKSGITTICGLSRHFKTMYGMILAAAYLKKHKDAVFIFYDNEFGANSDTMVSLGIDTTRVLHTPITDIEELTFDIVKQLNGINRGEKVFIMIDSIGNLASKKEVENAENEKSTLDMTRQKMLKSMYRIITPYLKIKDIPLVQVAHIYMSLDLYPKPIISGGQGILLASDTAWIITKSQEKEGTEQVGSNFTIKVEKSRFVKEKTAIPITVKFEGGLSRYTGLLDIALESSLVIKPNMGWYSRVDDNGEIEAKKWRAKDTDCSEFWQPLLKSNKFNSYIESTYKLAQNQLISDEEIKSEIEAVTEE